MLAGVVEKIILSQLSGIIQDLDKKQLKVNLWKGKIELENVCLNPRVLVQLNLPLIFKNSKIEKISIDIPWAALQTESVKVTVEGVYALLVPFHKEGWEFNTENFIEKRNSTLKKYQVQWEIEKEKKKMSEESQKQKNGYIDNLKEKILKNLVVSILGVHFRYEDTYKGSEHSMGISINSIHSLPDIDVFIT